MWMRRGQCCCNFSATFICSLFAGLFTTIAQGQIISQSVTTFEEHANEGYSVPDSVPNASVSGSLLSFMELVRQRTVGNQVEQCPCVVLSGSNRCISYDARFQASSLEEAIIAFVDTSLVDRNQGSLPITPSTFECSTEECRQCAGILAVRLRQIGLLRGSLGFPFTLPTQNSLRTFSCSRLRISRPIPVRTPPQNAPTSVESLIAAGAPLRAEYDQMPKSDFARTVNQALLESRAADGQPLISRFISAGSATGANPRPVVISRLASPAIPSSVVTATPSQRPSVNTPVSFPSPKLIPARLVAPNYSPDNVASLPPGPIVRPVSAQTTTLERSSQSAPAGQTPNRLFPAQVVNNAGARLNVNTVGRPSQQQISPQTPAQPPTPPISAVQPAQTTVPAQSTATNQGQFSSNMARPVQRPLLQRLRNNVRNQVFQRLNQPNTPWQQAPRSQQLPTRLTQPQQQQPQQNQGQLQLPAQFQQAQPQFSQPQFGVITPVQPSPQQKIQQAQQLQPQWSQQQQAQNWQWTATNNNNPPAQLVFQQQQQPFAATQQQSQVFPNTNNYPSNTNWLDSSNGLAANWQPAAGGQGNGVNQLVGNSWNVQQPQWQTVPSNPATQIVNSAGQVNNFVPSQQNTGQFGSNSLPGVTAGGQQQQGQQAQQQLGGISAGLGGLPFTKRTKRADEDNIIGDRFVINCVERGDPENENTDFLNLCTACWTWRQLPENYFPRLINELVCQESDYCLSGWGSCHQRYRNVDVLRRVGNDWRPTTISSASCCDCKVKAGSQIHPLVIGKNKR